MAEEVGEGERVQVGPCEGVEEGLGENTVGVDGVYEDTDEVTGEDVDDSIGMDVGDSIGVDTITDEDVATPEETTTTDVEEDSSAAEVVKTGGVGDWDGAAEVSTDEEDGSEVTLGAELATAPEDTTGEVVITEGEENTEVVITDEEENTAVVVITDEEENTGEVVITVEEITGAVVITDGEEDEMAVDGRAGVGDNEEVNEEKDDVEILELPGV
ncbi:hypothetical protein ACOMHN_001270 [Nucella lapillus]